MGAPPAEDVLKLRGIVTQYFTSRALYAAVVFRVAEGRADGARSVDELAAESRARWRQPTSAHRGPIRQAARIR